MGVALLVEVLAAAVSGATLGLDASPFSGTAGGPPKTGQFFIAINPQVAANNGFAARIERLVSAITAQDGARLPGQGRLRKRAKARADGVAVNAATLERIETLLPK